MSFFKGVSDRIKRTFSASYKQPPSEQVRQAERGEAWYRDFDWESFMASYFAGTRYIPGVGLGLITYPYVSVWEKVWGAVPIEDYSKYREYMTKDPFIRATLDLHTMMCTSGGFELDYPIDMVIEDMMNFLRRHDFINILKILVRDTLTFGNAYCEIVRVWMCTSQDHDLEQLKPSYEIEGADGKKVWYTDRMDVAEKHKELYPDHELINPYGEIVRLKPLDPYFMRVRRDAWGSHPPDERLIFFNDGRLVLETLEDYVKQNASKENVFNLSSETRLIRHPFILPSMDEDKVVLNISPYLIEHYYSGDMYTIHTVYGSTVKATGNHSVFTWKPKYRNHVFPGELELKETREIREGDYVLISRKLPVFKEIPLNVSVSKVFMENMNVEELHNFGIQSQSLKVEEYEDKVIEYLKRRGIKYPRQEYNHYRKKHILPLDFIKENNVPIPEDAIVISWHSKAKMKDRVESNGLLYFLGLIISDGCLSTDKKRTGIILFSGDSVKNNVFLETWLKENNIKFSKRLTEKRIVWKEQKKPISFPCLTIYNHILYSLCKFLLPKKNELPSWLYTLPLSQLKYFVKGLWDGDGWHKNTRTCFKYFTRDKRLAEDLVLLLKRFGIVASLNMKQDKGRPDYTIQAFVEPLDILKWDEGVKQKTRASAYGDFVIAKVKKIEKTFYEGVVYDFEVPGSQSYLSKSGILVHNTVLGYAQLYAVPIVTFLADEILHLRYMPSTEMYGSVYGESMLRPILYHEELLKEYEETISQIMKVYVKPMFLVKVGSPTGGPEVTAEQFREIMRSFSSRKPGSDVFIRTTGLITDVQPINPPISGLQTTQFWLEWLHNQRAYALTVPKHFVAPEGLNRACYVEDTYVLTENGWKLHNEVKEDEKIVVYEPESGRAWLEKPIKLYAYDYDGEIIHFVDKNTDIAVTPEHKIVYKKNLDGKWLTGHAEDIIGSQLILPNSMEWEGHEEEWEVIPSIELKEGFRTEFRENVKVEMDDFLSFVGIYLSEGRMDTVNHHLLTIAQTKKNVEKIEKIRTILSKLSFHYHEYEDKDCVRWNVDGKQLCTFLSSNFGERCYNKHIPPKYKNLSKRQLKILFDSMILGEESIDKKGSITYYTTSEQLAKDFLEIAVKLGYSANISYHDSKRGGNRRRVYRIFVSKRKLKHVPKNRIIKEHYKGKVYCFSTSTGFYVTMRNGKVAYQGNTAQMVQEAYFTFIQSIRNSIASQLEQDLFPKIMYSLYGEMAKVLMDEFGVPKIVWKPVREESFASKVPLIINLKKSGIIDTNEARTMLGLKPKEEYEEEEEEGEGGMELPLPPHGEKPPPSPPPTEKGTPKAPEEGSGEGARTEEKEEGGKKKEDQLKKIIENLKRKL